MFVEDTEILTAGRPPPHQVYKRIVETLRRLGNSRLTRGGKGLAVRLVVKITHFRIGKDCRGGVVTSAGGATRSSESDVT